MPISQRYVSHELTHFVGRAESDDEARYQLLLTILKSGKLIGSPRAENPPTALSFNPSEKLSSNRRYDIAAVCFCDIPLADLQIHMNKYGKFGLSFQKSFLISHGANPVFYIVKNSATTEYSASPREEHFNSEVDKLMNFIDREVDEFRSKPPSPENNARIRKLRDAKNFLQFQILGFLRFFDVPAGDEDPNNLYMEREWRVIGDLAFSIEHVERVILPKSFSGKVQEDLPAFVGQVLPIEDTN